MNFELNSTEVIEELKKLIDGGKDHMNDLAENGLIEKAKLMAELVAVLTVSLECVIAMDKITSITENF